MTIDRYAKHYYKQLLKYIDNSTEAVSNINQLYITATKQIKRNGDCTLINMLNKAVKLKAPAITDAFSYYLLSYSRLIVDPKNGLLLFDANKTIKEYPPSFIGWLVNNDGVKNQIRNIDVMKLKKVMATQRIVSRASKTPKSSVPSNIIQFRSECCPGCGKKFRLGSSCTIENHTCRTVKTGRSVWTISGGGGPGTGKRS